MEPPSNNLQPPVTPSHPSLLPALSPAMAEQQTPAPLQTLPAHLRQPMPQPNMYGQYQGQGTPGQAQSQQGATPRLGAPPNGPQSAQTPQKGQQQGNADENVFGSVMGAGPGQHSEAGAGSNQAKVYASVYSSIPVFEAMIRGISVMRRTSDSWVNATQILKVAGINKSARTKVLDKEVLTGIHEKVQGGYGKYQGTWIPLDRGKELAEQYGVASYLSPIFDFVPSQSAIAALPVLRTGTPDRTAAQKAPVHPNQRVISPYPAHATPLPGPGPGLPPHFAHPHEQMMSLPPHPSALAYPSQPRPYYSMPPPHAVGQPGLYPPAREGPVPMVHNPSDNGLAPAADIARMGFPYSASEVYIDQYGQPHATYQSNAYAKDGHPAKRLRSDAEGSYVETAAAAEAEEEGDAEVDSTASDDARDPPPLPSSMLLPHKPIRPKATTANGRIKAKLVQIFNVEGPVNLRSVFGLAPDQVPGFDVDMVIDDQGHSALHWACALAKMEIIQQLIDLGADIQRGNYAGETPLVRSVLTSNHAEAGTFAQLLSLLSPSIRTLDHAYRTVLHHIALVAGVKGRIPAARSYMANVLEWVAREQRNKPHSIAGRPQESESTELAPIPLKTLVDVQDVHGDTALNVAARVGNRAMVNLLLDGGADKSRANKLGLRPEHFGLEIEGLKVTNGEAVVNNLRSEVSKPERKSRDVQKNIAAVFERISSTFTSEMLAKQTKLNATENSVRHATRALADKRVRLHHAQEQLGTMHLYEQRAESVKRILDGVLMGDILGPSDFTGRSQTILEKRSAQLPPLAFRHVPGVISPSLHPIPSPHSPTSTDTPQDVPLPEHNDPEGLVKLRRMALWEDRVAEILEDKIQSLEGEGVEKEIKYRKLVAVCARVPVDKVDGMLDGLLAAVESDGQLIDFTKVNNFFHRVKEGGA
ncbi:hypothetical protein L202_06475 [Cryptococcus amylolentus CBS 6039]|uniref:HTH APSES-type domain-containing protein n=1 Tax=Cryptococcus amylolentus CBS 6039 TaxID=1295533 RepID=A0A1E3HG24_9TREE|nr:hypothetical protein L202_06475 [Cryptococcus amylolentus CBS 6039]ODN75292.1 hypothetical protein L202_06475 [Cryptococcus amylolentus CBS 6039]